MRGFLTYVVYRLLGGLTGHLPPRIGYWLATWTGRLLYNLSPRLRHAVTDNIRHVVGPEPDESEVQALVRQTCVNLNKGHFDLFRVRRLSADEIEEMVQAEGWENLEQVLAQGRGAIIFSAHVGNVDLVVQLSVIRGIPAITPVQRIEPERLFQYTMSLRTSHGLKMIPTDKPMFGLLRALKRGEIVGLAADRDVAESGRVVDFFGSPTRLPDGPVRLALRTGVPLVPAFAHRLPDNSFRVRIEPPLELTRTEDVESDVAAGMEMVVTAMERHIAQHPEQWLVATRIWPAE